jgi:DNA invertase Pin-like site-specific DNA recombinase
MFAVFTEFERDIIRERTVAGLDAVGARKEENLKRMKRKFGRLSNYIV